ncbi:LOW QUALITY PROTEIN: translocation protein SEC62-like [Paramacrobiotus metropolitanus]|uniref:LOW QUALITY PROTEIN: translocation protein SEC62-like n=1 Tax=Paramacrobiotus metropolitanus TaxID=2943436 RepID=UPI0024461E3E|nr:LOW QUALITY PROTEIN: translocation protein SEC62-like [Paramacrobiotus metropolitanus]
MSESRKRKNRGQQEAAEGPTKQDYAIAKYLRDKCPKKQTLFVNQKVYYFTGSKAVDVLLESKWAKGTKKENPIFTTRDQCVDYMNRLRDLEFITRAAKIVVKKVESKKEKDAAKEKKKKEKSSKEEKADSAAEDKMSGKRKNGKDKENEKDKAEKSDEGGQGEPDSPKGDGKDAKKKKKIRLELHSQQVFLDSEDAYVWVYEPTSILNVVMGVGLVFGAIGICLFPLWPPIVRQGVYYLSLLAVGLIGLLITVSLLRYVVFAIVWGVTMGRVHFWYLPNLTEDCGFFESFVPLYSCTKPSQEDKNKSKKDKKSGKSKEKDSDKEDQEDVQDDDNDDEAAPEPVPADSKQQGSDKES